MSDDKTRSVERVVSFAAVFWDVAQRLNVRQTSGCRQIELEIAEMQHMNSALGHYNNILLYNKASESFMRC